LELSYFNVTWFSQGQTFVSTPITGIHSHRPKGIWGFGWRYLNSGTAIFAPHWFGILLFALLAALAAVHVEWARRFSVRTLLVATTLFALLLGALKNFAQG
jgi:hypothetical protein